MYKYKGWNIESKQKLEKHDFEDETEAKNFANNNAPEFPKFTVTDDGDEIVYSDKNADDEDADSNDRMFPDDESREGFDYTFGE